MTFEKIQVTVEDGGIATLLLNDPDSRNAMTPDMGEAMVAAVERLRGDPGVRVVLVTGAGRSFSAGGNLAMLARDAGLSGDEGPSMKGSPKDFYSRFLSIRRLEVPTIAVINGHAIGAGLCFALGCDMRIAAREAKMGMTFVRLGIHPGMGATHLLPRLVGSAVACELLFSGRVFDAAEAARLGLVNRVVNGDALGDAARQLAEEIAGAGPIAVRMTKRAIYQGLSHNLEESLELEALQQGVTFGTEDAKEGIRAMMEKREPRFAGR
jgi:enoyl-CoA hydratase/carnithine racemase